MEIRDPEVRVEGVGISVKLPSLGFLLGLKGIMHISFSFGFFSLFPVISGGDTTLDAGWVSWEKK